MSSPGTDDLGFYNVPVGGDTDDSIQRRLAYARALQAQAQHIPQGAYGGLNSAVNSITGAYLGQQANKDQAQRYAQMLQNTIGSPQTTSTPAPPPQYGQYDAPPVTGQQVTPQAAAAGPTQSAQYDAPDITTPAPTVPPPTQTTQYSGPLGQALGNQKAALYAAMLQGMGPEEGRQMLSNLAVQQGNRMDQTVQPMTAQEAQAAGLNPSGVYAKDSLGHIQTVQAPTLETPAQIQQKLDIARQTGQLPPTQEQQATMNLERAKFGEEQRHNKAQETIAMNPFGGPQAAAAAGQGLTGDSFLQALPAGIASQVKAIGTYRQTPPNTRSPLGIKMMDLVNQAYPDYDSTQFTAKNKARNDFATGKNGNTVRSLNVAVSHLDTLGGLADALGNGDGQLANRLGQAWSQQTGETPPTNFDAAKQIVGDEIVKAIVGTGGSQQDRDKAADSITRVSSPQQLHGVIQTYQQLLGGQLNGMRQQYHKTTGLNDFNDYLSPNTLTRIGHLGSAPPAAAPKIINYDSQGNRLP